MYPALDNGCQYHGRFVSVNLTSTMSASHGGLSSAEGSAGAGLEGALKYFFELISSRTLDADVPPSCSLYGLSPPTPEYFLAAASIAPFEHG